MQRLRTGLLLHPLFLFALAVLLLNDWALKAMWPSVATGKLSDFAGLVVAPVLVCAVLGLERGSRREIVTVHAVVGGLFAVVQFVPVDAWYPFVADLVPRPRLWPDPTDLVALAVLPWSVRFVLSPPEAPAISPRWAVVPTLLVASFAVLATSYVPVITEESEILLEAETEEAAFEHWEQVLSRVLEAHRTPEYWHPEIRRYDGIFRARVASSGDPEAGIQEIRANAVLLVGWDDERKALWLAEVGMYDLDTDYQLLGRVEVELFLPTLRAALRAEQVP
ncbi:MAG: hypothetical protein AAGI91_09215 [Bacteroidota bacterium]